MLFRRYAVAFLTCFPLFVHADTVWLDNGDRLTGKVELLDRGRLVIKTEFAGEVTVKVGRIRTLETTTPMLVKTEDHAERALAIKTSEKPGHVLVFNGLPDPVDMPLANISQLMEPQPFIQDWLLEGNADLSFDMKDASQEEEDLAFRFNTRARHGDWRHDLAANFERDYRDDVRSRHLLQTEYDLSWFFGEQWFWQTSLDYERDHIGDIARRAQIGAGPGYEWWNTSLSRFETSARLDHLRLREQSGAESQFEALGLEYDYRKFMFGKRVELFHNTETQIPDDSDVKYIVDTELGLRYMVNSWASLSLLTEWDYIESDNAEQALNEKRYRVGFGVSW